MDNSVEKNELFKASHMMILLSYTLFAVVLTLEAFIMDWEKWALLIVGVGVFVSWFMHIRHFVTDKQRLWFYASFMMLTFFFYGVHQTSTFDLAVVMAAILFLFTMTGNKNLITLGQCSFYATMIYSIIVMIREKTEFDALIISRTILHLAMITMISWFARTIINKWTEVLDKTNDEINDLTESTERLNDFLANVSHEIRTPVNAVIGLSGICIDKEQNTEIRNDMISVRSAGRKVAEQIGDILDYSEIDRGNLVKNSEDYMISSVMHDLVTEIRESKPDAIELVINIDPATPAVMNSDVAKIKKIFRALISNGLKYTRVGGVYVNVEAEKHSYGVNLNIEVTDTGIGMNEEELEHVYEKFYQSDSGRARIGGGLGLGLGIVSGFVSVLGGFMTISSKPDVGTTVRVSIPQTVVDDSSCMSVKNPDKLCLGAYLHFDKFENPLVREYYNLSVMNIVKGLRVQMHRVDNVENLKKIREAFTLTHLFVGEDEYTSNKELIEEMGQEMVVIVVASSGFKLPPKSNVKIMEKPFYCFPVVSILNSGIKNRKTSHSKFITKNIKALVVDDEPMNLIVARSIFKRYGMEVSTVTSGPESINICKEQRFDIIFMDHMMGGMDGVEAMKRIRSDVSGLNQNAPIIALTANAMSSAKQMFMSVGFDGFVSKPIETEKLERALKKVLPKNSYEYVFDADIKDDIKDSESSDAANESDAAKASDKAEELTDSNSDIEGDSSEEKADASTDKGGAESDDAPVTFSGKLKAVGLNMETAMTYCAGDIEFYKVLLNQFASEAKEKIAAMNTYKAGKDWKNYEIIIHAVKSTSKMIGGLDLSEEALNLEHAANNEDEEYISKNHQRVMDMYKKVYSGIFSALGKPLEEEKTEQSDPAEDVMEFGPSGDDEAMEFGPSGDDEAMEFGPSDDDEVMEFGPSGEDEVMEFGLSGEDEVMEFAPETEE